MKGEYKGLDKQIAGRAKGTLMKIRTGQITDKDKGELKETFSKPELIGKPRNTRGGRLISLRNGDQTIAILVKKTGGKWLVSEMTIRTKKR